jgi:Tol biopolymer transport system component
MRIATVLVLTACAVAAFGLYPGKIAFTSNRDGNPEIYVMKADGSGVVRLTNNKAYDDQPALSPDGAWVVFVSNRDGNHELYVVGVDGKNLRRLTDTSYSEIDPSFSPDGRWVVYTAMAEGDKDIWRLNVESGETEVLVTGNGDQFMARMAADGALAYVENGGDNEVVILESGVKTDLSDSPGIDTLPMFSPDGTTVYFITNRGGDYDLIAVNRDGSGLREIITLESTEGRAWPSPDGAYLAVTSDKDGDMEIYIFSPDGDLLEQITDNEYEDYEPSWSK